MKIQTKISLLITIIIGVTAACSANGVYPVAKKRLPQLLLLLMLPIALAMMFMPTKADGATQIFRSVGSSATGSLADGSASNAMTISGTTAAFAEALASQVGVGDAIQYDDDGDDDIDANDSII